MPRLSNGDYVLPLPDVVSGETITSSWANTTMNDIAASITDSLDREGRGGMNASFQFADGTQAAPGAAWSAETSTGFYRAAAGDLRVSVLGTDMFRWKSDTGVQVWNGSAWQTVLTSGGGDGTVPPGTTAWQTLTWNGNAWISNSTLRVDNNTPSVTITGSATVSSNLTVNGNILTPGTVDGVDVSAHAGDTSIHFSDAPIDGNEYVRKDAGWVLGGGGTGVTPGTVDGNTLVWDDTTSEWIESSGLNVADSGDVAIVGAISTKGKLLTTGFDHFEVKATPTGSEDANTVYFFTG